ncbi:MAG: hypothetical protein GX627_00090 [Parcubacteria group bacterium]|nr:hypothetical protein [Parcubacteria group bacterium]
MKFFKKFLPQEKKRNRGFSLVEALIAIFIIAFCILAIWRIYVFFVKTSLSNAKFFQGAFLADEGVEAVKFMRDGGWSSNIAPLTLETPYSLIFDGTKWEATPAISYIDGVFDRRAIFSAVYRDADGNIADSGALDEGTRKVKIIVSWSKDSSTTTREITTYVSNLFKN